MKRTFDPAERPVLKSNWKPLPSAAHSSRIGRSREVWLSAVTDALSPVAEEFRWDFQGTDNWIEVSKLSSAYLRHLHSEAVRQGGLGL